MSNDKDIEFKIQKSKIEKILSRLHEASIESFDYDSLLNEIDTSSPIDVIIEKQEAIYKRLQKYEAYLKISAFCKSLKIFLASPSVAELNTHRESLLSLLREFKDTITVNVEVPIEDIYYVTYEFIKAEIKLLGSSPTLNNLKNDDFHALNLDKQIAKELEGLDLKSDQYLALAAKKYAIDAQGFDNNYLNEDLIATLIRSINPQDNVQILEELSKKIENYESELNSFVQEIKRQGTTEEIKKIKYSFGKIRKNIVLFVTSASVAIGIAAGAVTLQKKISTDTTYETTTSTYNPKLEEQEEPTVEYTTTKNNGTYLCEYQPYVKTDSGFEREILTYDVSNFEGLTEDEYFDLDLNALGINPSTSHDPKLRLSLEDLYTESYSVLKKVHVNPEKTDSEVSYDWETVVLVILLCVGSAAVVVGIEQLYIKLNFNEREENYLSFIDSICEIRKHYQNIKASKLSIKEKEEALNVLKEKAYRLYQENREIINRLQTLISEANFNPAFAPELEQMQNNLSRIRVLNEKVQK